MKRPCCARAGAVLILAALLQSCGGGGGDGGGSEPGSKARLTISSSNISVSATPGDLPPESTITFAVTDNPPDVVYIAINHSANGLDGVGFNQTGPADGELEFLFRSPGSLVNGTYEDSVEVRVCLDDQCRTDVKGSPKTIHTAYVVSGDGPTSAAVSRSVIELTVDHREIIGRNESISVTVDEIPPSGIHVVSAYSTNAIESVGEGPTGLVTNMSIGFASGEERDLGTYSDSVAVRVCYDQSCVRQATGSPFEISTTFNVTLGVEPGLPSLQILSREPIGHDIIDAEYSAAMNAIVMIGSYPQDAIYVYKIDTGIESEQLLDKAATAVSVAPDGLTAAVGHDAFISVVDLPLVGTAGAPAPTLLNVSIPVHDVALASNGHVYAVPRYEQGDNIHTVDIATNTEQQTPGFVQKIGLHASGGFLYGTPDGPFWDLIKWDVSSGVPVLQYHWPYTGEHSACSNFWFSEAGDRIYTACGETFSADADPAQDLVYVGTIPITEPVHQDEHFIRALANSVANNEIALIEWHHFDCQIGPLYRPCYTRLAYVDAASLSRKAIYAIGPVTIGGGDFAQRGRYVFHDALSSRKYLIGEVENPPNEDLRFWLSVVE